LNNQESAEAIVGKIALAIAEGPNIDEWSNVNRKFMSQKRQKISNEPATGRDGEYISNSGGVETQQTTVHESTIDTTNLLETIVEKGNLLRALKRVEKNKGAAGIDGMTTQELRGYLKQHSLALKEQLISGRYRHKPVRRVSIPKANGGMRDLGIPTVLDRLVQQMVLQVLEPIFEPGFSDSSFGFRPGRSAHQAILQAKEYITDGHHYVVDIDLEKFFDLVNHDILMSRVARKIKDERVLKLIRGFLKAGVMLNGCCVVSEEGTPQGGPISPLLSNIMLDDLDKELEKRGHKFCRYADDCNLYVKSARAGQRVLEGVSDFLTRKLKLRVNKDKSATDIVSKRKFLGFSFQLGRELKIRLAPAARERLKAKLRQLTSRTWGISLDERIQKINGYLGGWLQYFKLAETPSVFASLYAWMCRRLRQCLLRQWRKPKTRFRNLVRAGIAKEKAARISASSKGTWRLALTPQLHIAFGNAYWHSLGLLDLGEQYKVCRSSL
jgi:group II intron reverse transcriptase/maturase